MNLLERVQMIADGVKNLTLWVGAGGEVVEQSVAEERSRICAACPLNKPDMKISEEVARAIRIFLEFKNGLNLRVSGESSLSHCEACGCVLPLLIWEPQARVRAHMTEEEIRLTPSFCWKLKA